MTKFFHGSVHFFTFAWLSISHTQKNRMIVDTTKIKQSNMLGIFKNFSWKQIRSRYKSTHAYCR
jgi:hypothetical protein